MEENIGIHLRELAAENMQMLFVSGDSDEVWDRLENELDLAEQFQFDTTVMLAGALCKNLKKENLPYWCSGTTSNSFLLYLFGISHVNPLLPHYRCPNCGKINWIDYGKDIFVLQSKSCSCGCKMIVDGHNLSQMLFFGSREGNTRESPRKIHINVSADKFCKVCEMTKKEAVSCKLNADMSGTGNTLSVGKLCIHKSAILSGENEIYRKIKHLPFSEKVRTLGLELGTWRCEKVLAVKHLNLPVFYDDVFDRLIAAEFSTNEALKEAEKVHVGKSLSEKAINAGWTDEEKFWLENAMYMFPRGHVIEVLTATNVQKPMR